MSGWLQQAGQEDNDDCQRADVSDEEPQYAEDPGVATESSAVGEFIIYVRLLHAPSYKEDCQQTAEGHQNV